MVSKNSILGVINKNILYTIFFTVVFFTIISFSISFTIEKRALDRKAEKYINRLTKILEVPMWNFDSTLIKDLIKIYINNESICKIYITNPSGAVIYEITEHKFKNTEDSNHLLKTKKIVKNGQYLGTVNVLITKQFIYGKLRELFIINFIQALILSFTLIVILKGLFKKQVLKPLEILTNSIKANSFTHYVKPIEDDFNYEFASIKDTFNQMVENIKRYHKDIQEMNFKLLSLLDTIPDAVLLHSIDGQILEVNKTAEIIYGYSSEEIIKKDIELLSAKGFTNKMALDNFKKVLKKGYLEFNWQVKQKSGTEIPVVVRLKKLVLHDEIFILSVVTDISEQKKNEEKILEEKEKLNVILRSIGDGIIVTDNSGQILIMNKSAQIITGYSEVEVFADTMDNILKIKEDNKFVKLYKILEEVILDRKIIEFKPNTILFTKNNEEKIIQGSYSPIIDKNDDVIGTVLVFKDITEKEKLEQEIIKNQKLESIGLLAGGIAHDFNNLLTAITSYLELIKLNDKANEFKTYTDDIAKILSRAKSLTNQLLTFSKGGTPIKELVHICHAVKDTAKFVLRGSGVKLRIYRDEDLWTTEVDEDQISQAIHNIVLNAKQAMNDKGMLYININNIELEEENDFLAPKGKYVKIKIEDTGKGIDNIVLNRIFDPFFTTKKDGNGLGLAMTHSIIKKHKGFIRVYSEKNKGTTFEIILPAKLEKITEKIKEISKIDTLKNIKILLLDDEKVILNSASELLSFLGCEVKAVTDGKDVIKEYKSSIKANSKFDIVILDLTIPGGMGGKETIKKLLEIDENVVAVVSSGYSDDEVMAHYEKYGFKGMIAKPYTIETISNVISNLLNNKKVGI